MNTLIYGPNNSGKTDRIIFKEINAKIEKSESVLFLDPKEEYYHHYYQMLVDHGYKINVLNLKRFKRSNNWNPLLLPYKIYQENQDQSIDMLRSLGKEIFNDENELDKFWTNASTDLFIGLCLILYEFAMEEAINLYSVNHLLEYSDDFGVVLDKFKNKSSIYLALDEILSSPKETKQSIYTFFKQKLNVYLLYNDLSNLLSSTSLDVQELKEGKVALFIINRISNKKINNLANIYIDQLYEWLSNNKIKHRFNLVLDNIQSIDKLNSLDNMLLISEDSKIDIYISTRDIEWYKKYYSSENINVIYNLDVTDSVIKVTSGSKRKYSLAKYPKIVSKGTYEYPLLEEPTKYLFNLSNYLKNND